MTNEEGRTEHPQSALLRIAGDDHVVECAVHGVLPETRHVFGPMLKAALINHSHCVPTVADADLPPLEA